MKVNDEFPERTAITFIRDLDKLGTVGHKRINEHVIKDYYAGLRASFLMSSWRRAWPNHDDFDALYNEFFLRKLNKRDFYSRWLENGMQLRYWILNAFTFFLQDEYKRRRKHDGVEYLDLEQRGPECYEPEKVMSRGMACSIVERACQEMQERCEKKGLAKHWRILRGKRLEGKSYEALGLEHGVTELRARMMARTARENYREVLGRICHEHGTPASGVDGAIQDLLKDLDP